MCIKGFGGEAFEAISPHEGLPHVVEVKVFEGAARRQMQMEVKAWPFVQVKA